MDRRVQRAVHGRVTQFRDQPRKLYSPVFTSPHGHHWRLLLFCRGNGTNGTGPSFYLDVSNAVLSFGGLGAAGSVQAANPTHV